MLVRSPKTEHHEGKESGWVPLFPELRPTLAEAFALGPKDEFVVTQFRDGETNLRTGLERIIANAGLTPWPKLFQNLRSTRETELAETFPLHVVTSWCGNSQLVAAKHYLQVTADHFEQAVTSTEALQNPVQHTAVWSCTDSQTEVSISVSTKENGTVRDDAVQKVPPTGVERGA